MRKCARRFKSASGTYWLTIVRTAIQINSIHQNVDDEIQSKVHSHIKVSVSLPFTFKPKSQASKTMRRKGSSSRYALPVAAAVLFLAPSSVLARGVTTVPSGISGVDNHFPAGLFNWSSLGCGGGGVDFCGTLDFCEDGDKFGYALPGDDCQPYNGPTIRLAPGKKYRLTLRNFATISTNLHTHGLHIVGAGDSDDITRSVDSGECLDYTWDIPKDHPGGTNWYHPHLQINSESQVGGGAMGLLIVDDNLHINPDVPLWASYERVLQIFRSPDVGYITNGEDVAEVEVERDRWFRLRVSVVDPLAVPDRFLIEGCNFMKIAHDGVWSSTVPIPPSRLSRYLLAGSSRSDFVVKCNSEGRFDVRFRGRTVARIVSGRARSEVIPLREWKPERPQSMAGLRETFVPRENTFDVVMSDSGINGIPWNEDVPLREIAYDQVHEWTIVRSEVHAFHAHLYHAMVVSPGGCGAMHQEGEFYDTISGFDPTGRCRIRFRTADIGQRELLHCHVFEHSDQGAMGWVNVVGRNMPENNVDSPPYQCRRPVNCDNCDDTFPTYRPSSKPTSVPTRNPTDRPTPRLTPVPTRNPTRNIKLGDEDDGFASAVFSIESPSVTAIPGNGAGPSLTSIGFVAEGCGLQACGECFGDCDTDNDCAGDLRCYQRFGFEAVPGCTGPGISRKCTFCRRALDDYYMYGFITSSLTPTMCFSFS